MNPTEFSFGDEMDADYREWKERVERIEENIRRAGRRDLEVLARVGANRKSMVTLLALAATEDRKWLLKLMRQRQSALKSISRRIDLLGEQAKRFGLYLRAWGKTDIGVALLLARYHMFNPKMSHLEELARLLTDAFEADGKQKCFSADGLRKTYARRGKRLLVMWVTFNTPAPPTAVPSPPAPIGRSILGP
jgi:hypothetical protein